MTARAVLALVCALSAAAPGAARAEERGHDGTTRRPLTHRDADAGVALYLEECSACHGERGDGAGPAAAYLEPRPRDFTKRLFKLRTTPSGKPPATADVLRTIERGVPGTAMPSFAFLTAGARARLAAHVLALAGLLDGPEPVAAPTPPAPTANAALVARGAALYADARCASCHGERGEGDGDAVEDLRDAEGRPSRPRDFTRDPYRGGDAPLDLYYRIATGMDGTPMPSYLDALAPPELWALANYVRSLRAPAPTAPLPPADPIAAGRDVAARYGCRGCHVLDDGVGGDVGPDLRLSARKLLPGWVRGFLGPSADPGKIYPDRVARMPRLRLTNEEVEAMTAYMAAMGGRPSTRDPAPPDASVFPAADVERGRGVFTSRCAPCHALGATSAPSHARRRGPDLSRVAGRIDYEWVNLWLVDHPQSVDPGAPRLPPDEIEAVRKFVWK